MLRGKEHQGAPRALLGQSTARKRVDDGRVETSWTTQRWKLLRRGASRKQVDQVLLFDLEADPGETQDLAFERPAVRDRLAAELRAMTEAAQRQAAPQPADFPPDTIERLRELGYVEDERP